jgi:Zn-finger nucleic acid-binding protein
MTEEGALGEAWVDEVRPGDRKCPVCGTAMRIEKRDGVSIDVCADHGIWLDQGELEGIVAAVRRRADRVRRSAVRRARRDGKVKGAFWGFWSLLGE